MIRLANPDELDYVTATWLAGMLRGSRKGRWCRSRLRRDVEMLVETQTVLVHVIAVDDAERVMGWCCTTPLASTAVVHYVYVRHEFAGLPMRRRGIGRDLLLRAGVNLAGLVPYTHATELLPALTAKSGVRVVQFAVEKVLA